MKCIMEYGYSWYKSFDSVKEAIEWGKKTGYNGIIYTEDGHLINEEKALENGE